MNSCGSYGGYWSNREGGVEYITISDRVCGLSSQVAKILLFIWLLRKARNNKSQRI